VQQHHRQRDSAWSIRRGILSGFVGIRGRFFSGLLKKGVQIRR
jgi:hypothetical protein